MNSAGFAQWVRQYNHSKVCESSRPQDNLHDLYSDYFSVSSDLPRALHSCEIAMGEAPEMQSDLYREMDIPRYRLPIKMNAWTWVYINRCLWMLGKTWPFESYAEAKNRAEVAAIELTELTAQHNNVIVFAHGFLNLHIRKELLKKGWKLQAKANQYWGASILSKRDPNK